MSLVDKVAARAAANGDTDRDQMINDVASWYADNGTDKDILAMLSGDEKVPFMWSNAELKKFIKAKKI